VYLGFQNERRETESGFELDYETRGHAHRHRRRWKSNGSRCLQTRVARTRRRARKTEQNHMRAGWCFSCLLELSSSLPLFLVDLLSRVVAFASDHQSLIVFIVISSTHPLTSYIIGRSLERVDDHWSCWFH